MKPAFDISNEFILQKFNSGAMLTRPEKRNIIVAGHRSILLSDLMSQPFSVWITNNDSTTLRMGNENCADVCGYETRSELVGASTFDYLKKEQANISIDYDKSVLKNKKLRTLDFEFIRHDDFHIQFLDFKLPLYNESTHIIGTIGCGIDMNNQNRADLMAKLLSTGLLSTSEKYLQPDDIYLSRREQECLHYTIRGKSAKQIGQILNLSSRTVEEYLNNIKNKYSVTSKSELIDKVLGS